MMNAWNEYRFSDFVNINPPVTLKAGQEYSFIEMKDLEDGNKYCTPKTKRIKSGGAKFQNGDTLFARITPCLENGKICQVKDLEGNEGLGSTEFYVFRGTPGISDTEFIYYLSRWDDVRDHAEINLDGTSGRQRVPKACFDDLIINMPPLSEQTAIASVLSSLDDKIDLLHRQNETLEKMAETLFRQWFVEEAKEEWTRGKLSDLGTIITGKTPSTKVPTLWGDHIPFMTPSDYNRFGMYSAEPERFISKDGWNKSKNIQLPPNSIMVTCIGSDMGKICIANDYCITNQQINSIVLNNESTLGYIYNYLKSQYEAIRNIAFGGTTMPIINKTDFSNLDILIPSNKIIQAFNNFWGDWSEKIKSNSIQIRTLTSLRDTLLPKLMNREVGVEI